MKTKCSPVKCLTHKCVLLEFPIFNIRLGVMESLVGLLLVKLKYNWLSHTVCVYVHACVCVCVCVCGCVCMCVCLCMCVRDLVGNTLHHLSFFVCDNLVTVYIMKGSIKIDTLNQSYFHRSNDDFWFFSVCFPKWRGGIASVTSFDWCFAWSSSQLGHLLLEAR